MAPVHLMCNLQQQEVVAEEVGWFILQAFIFLQVPTISQWVLPVVEHMEHLIFNSLQAVISRQPTDLPAVLVHCCMHLADQQAFMAVVALVVPVEMLPLEEQVIGVVPTF